MPNWCYGKIQFYGVKHNVLRLYEDIQSALQYDRNKKIWNRVNMWYFLEKTGFSPSAYLSTENERDAKLIKDKNKDITDDSLNFATYLRQTNLRAYFIDCDIIYDEYGMMGVEVQLDSAWNLDPALLFLISKKYEVIYRYTSFEPGCGFATKGAYGFLPLPEEQFILNGYTEWKEGDNYEYESVEQRFNNRTDAENAEKQFRESNSDSEELWTGIIPIDVDRVPPGILGMYYEDINCIPGMIYDIEIK